MNTALFSLFFEAIARRISASAIAIARQNILHDIGMTTLPKVTRGVSATLCKTTQITRLGATVHAGRRNGHEYAHTAIIA